MKIRFKHQEYQADAVAAVVDCFEGQPYHKGFEYLIDPGRFKGQQTMEYDDEGIRNYGLQLSDDALLHNIRKVQQRQGLPVDSKLVKKSVCGVNLDVEMETGTGKTYVYTKTIFELHKRYGWSKFIIVVPSIAIREGVAKSFEMTRDHFLEEYGLQARTFIYDSKSPQNIKSFSTDGGIWVMIINFQAFNARGKDARRIYEELDEFESRRPIDLIKANHPILILDEPQKMGKKTLESLKEFNPLMILRYSATHKTKHNRVYRLDAIDAYNRKLVKKITVKGIEAKHLGGTSAYLYLQDIEISKERPPAARVELEIKQKSGIKRIVRKVEKGRSLYDLSNELEQYKGLTVTDLSDTSLELSDGTKLYIGDVVGDVNEALLRRIQIREAIRSHLNKERELYRKGIKVLSLFFIDEVAKYRYYDEEGEAQPGEYARIFEEEYKEAVKDMSSLFGPDYHRYLLGIEATKTHNGYFSIDKKGKLTDPSIKTRGEEKGLSDDVNAYDLILKDKERLLSFEEPTRFIFSHSALREGWDNPNIFVICTLKHSDSTVARRQEVGRGMRLAVNREGERIDDREIVHDINVLTVIANESYRDFAKGLQKEIAEAVSDRPKTADIDYFKGKLIRHGDEKVLIDEKMARQLYNYLVKNDYVDDDGHITPTYIKAREENSLAPLPEALHPVAEPILLLVDTVYSDAKLPPVENEFEKRVNPVNRDNLQKKEFLALWEQINQKAVYAVDFDSDELIIKAVQALDKELKVGDITYRVETGELKESLNKEALKNAEAMKLKDSYSQKGLSTSASAVRYDLIGKLAEGTQLTRRTIGKILHGVGEKTFANFKKNPEAFIREAVRIINEQKAIGVVEHIVYDKREERHKLEEIFVPVERDRKRLEAMKKHVYDYVETDSGTEKDFVQELDNASEVVVYAKLPNNFSIPTPVGSYNPDWAIAFEEGRVKHIYFVAETKGSMSSIQLKKIEEMKIECARRFFDKIVSSRVKYDIVAGFDDLMRLVND